MKKILIVDDEQDFCFLIKDALEVTGKYKIIIATDGKNGLKAALDHKPDLVLLDIMMPGIDGLEVLKRLKEDERTQALPVIMLTAKSDDQTKTKAASLYDEDYLVKPVEIGELRYRIERILSKTSPR